MATHPTTIPHTKLFIKIGMLTSPPGNHSLGKKDSVTIGKYKTLAAHTRIIVVKEGGPWNAEADDWDNTSTDINLHRSM
jgi:hypothetical protein